MGIPEPDPGDEIVGESIPPSLPPDITKPTCQPRGTGLRSNSCREQWDAGILQLLSKLPAEAVGEERTLRYVGLPGQHHLDVLSMGGICIQKKLRLDYLGFRTGGGPRPPRSICKSFPSCQDPSILHRIR